VEEMFDLIGFFIFHLNNILHASLGKFRKAFAVALPCELHIVVLDLVVHELSSLRIVVDKFFLVLTENSGPNVSEYESIIFFTKSIVRCLEHAMDLTGWVLERNILFEPNLSVSLGSDPLWLLYIIPSGRLYLEILWKQSIWLW